MALLAGSPALIQAADPGADATTLAIQKDTEERFRRLAAEVQDLQEAQQTILKRQETLQQRLSNLLEEMRSLKEEQNRASGNLVSRDEFRKYAEKLKEMDEKREADKKLILKEIGELAKVPAAPAPVEKAPSHRASATESPEEMPYVYVVKKNDRLLDIIAAYNDYFKKEGKGKITKEQVLKANPNLKSDRVIAGQKIHIPVPQKDSK